MTKHDISKVEIPFVVCLKCDKLFHWEKDGDKIWIKSDDLIPFCRCKACYDHPDHIMSGKPDFSKYKQTCLC